MWTIDSVQFARRKKLTASGVKVTATLTDWPLLAQFASDTDLGAYMQADGDDIRFTDANGNLLSAEKDNFAIAGGAATGQYWVKIPTFTASTAYDIWVYYGNPNAAAQATPSAVWSAIKAVWHLNETAATDNAVESSALGLTGTKVNDPGVATGQLGGCRTFTGTEYFDLGTASRSALTGATSTALSCWLKMNSVDAFRTLYGAYKTSGEMHWIRLNSTGSYVANRIESYRRTYVGGLKELRAITQSVANPAYSDNAWHHFAFRLTAGGSGICTIDGTAQTLSYPYTQNISTANLAINLFLAALNLDNVAGQFYIGSLDEVRLYNTALAQAWMVADYWFQKDAAQLAWGAEETAGPIFSRIHLGM